MRTPPCQPTGHGLARAASRSTARALMGETRNSKARWKRALWDGGRADGAAPGGLLASTTASHASHRTPVDAWTRCRGSMLVSAGLRKARRRMPPGLVMASSRIRRSPLRTALVRVLEQRIADECEQPRRVVPERRVFDRACGPEDRSSRRGSIGRILSTAQGKQTRYPAVRRLLPRPRILQRHRQIEHRRLSAVVLPVRHEVPVPLELELVVRLRAGK
jgi:hypothetical protein